MGALAFLLNQHTSILDTLAGHTLTLNSELGKATIQGGTKLEDGINHPKPTSSVITPAPAIACLVFRDEHDVVFQLTFRSVGRFRTALTVERFDP